MSDFKSNEYASLLGGIYFEDVQESNPMLGLRGACRYTHDSYKQAFKLECDAILHVLYTPLPLMLLLYIDLSLFISPNMHLFLSFALDILCVFICNPITISHFYINVHQMFLLFIFNIGKECAWM